MKKVLSLLLTLIIIAFFLAGCGKKTNNFTGTWVVDSVEVDGSKFTASEMEAMDSDNWMSKTLIVLKDGGKAYVAEGGVDGVIVDWYETTDGKVLVDGMECAVVDGLIRMEVYDDEIIYFRKSSDSQTIQQPDEKTPEETASNETEPEIVEEKPEANEIETETPEEETPPQETEDEAEDMTQASAESSEDTSSEGGIRPEFKAAMDDYEEFYKEYCDFMNEYSENPTDLTLLAKYGEILTKAQEMDKSFEAWDEDDLTNEELEYYLDVNNRVMKMLLDVAG